MELVLQHRRQASYQNYTHRHLFIIVITTTKENCSALCEQVAREGHLGKRE